MRAASCWSDRSTCTAHGGIRASVRHSLCQRLTGAIAAPVRRTQGSPSKGDLRFDEALAEDATGGFHQPLIPVYPGEARP